MTRRILFVAFLTAISASGCPCRRPPERPTDVSAPGLLRIFRDSPSIAHDAYTGRRVRVQLEPGEYRIIPGGVGHPPAGVGWFTGFADTPPAVVFRCDPPPDETYGLVVVGLCRGAVTDGVRRSPGIDFGIVVDECQVTVIPPSVPRSP